jgi:hypothetical protein
MDKTEQALKDMTNINNSPSEPTNSEFNSDIQIKNMTNEKILRGLSDKPEQVNVIAIILNGIMNEARADERNRVIGEIRNWISENSFIPIEGAVVWVNQLIAKLNSLKK